MKPLEKRYDVVHRPLELSLAGCRGGRNGHRPEAELNGYANKHANSASSSSNSSPSSKPASLVLPYTRGEEMKIQQEISRHDPLEPLAVVLLAEEGLSGDASWGFTRALRKEYRAWTIRVAVFDKSWTQSERHKAAHHILAVAHEELDLRVEADGAITVPRIEPSAPPRAEVPLDVQKPWKMEDGSLVQMSLPQVDDEFVLVRIDSIASRHGDKWSYVGTTEGTTQKVVGVASGPVASHLAVHNGSIVDVAPHLFVTKGGSTLGPSILAPTLVSLAVGPLDPRRFRASLALVIDEDATFRSQILEVCVALGMNVIVTAALTSKQLEKCYLHPPAFVFSGTRDPKTVATMRHISTPETRLMLWNNQEDGLAALSAKRPWAVGDAVRHALAYASRANIPYTPIQELLVNFPVKMAVREVALFDRTKAYLLIGGMGSLGLHIALWMYQVRRKHGDGV